MSDIRLHAALKGDLRRIVDAEKRAAAQGATRAINYAGSGLQRELRTQVRRAGLGIGVEKAWQRQKYPGRGNSLGAANLVFSKADRVHQAFSADRTVRGRNGNWLVIPLPPAVAR
ncbi:MAG: hypothetical protein KDA49_06395, partial [Rhodospirillaceae bacterium]|nr:hypothetical protein [Rhodospirillaceae bacterium]